MDSILIIDDSNDILKQLKWGLGKEYDVHLAGNVDEGLASCAANKPKVVLLDLGLPPHEDGTEEGFRCLTGILKDHSMTKVIVVTGQGDRENALRAIQLGAYDFYQKPIDLKELRIIIKRAMYLYTIEEDNSRLQESMAEFPRLNGIIGKCEAMAKIFATSEKIASADIPVLITGESGTGKEVIARAIHSMSMRKNGPFVPINCGAIPETLLESELFGFEKGSFTGAHAQLQGKVEYADNGTLFLDEIGELPPSLQVKLLRFLQEKTIQRVGGRKDIAVNARIIAATNLDINKAISEGMFRADLYYRIGGVTLNLPALRDRGDDIILISNFILKRYSDNLQKKVKGFSPASLDCMRSYKWPGNIRELENRIQSAVIMSDSPHIEPHDLGFAERALSWGPDNLNKEMTLKEVRDRAERELILTTFTKYKGNMSKIAEILEISRPTLYDLMKKHGIREHGRTGESMQSSSFSDKDL